MPEYRVNVSKLREKYSEKVEELKKFLEDRMKVNVDVSGDELIVRLEKGVSMRRRYLRELLRKFLHQAELKEDFRVISGGMDSFIVKDKKKREVE